MSRFGFGYANRQTVDPAVVKTAVLFFLAPMLAGAILWVCVSTIPETYNLLRTLALFRPTAATILAHKHLHRSTPAPAPQHSPTDSWQPRLLFRYRVGSLEVESWTHDPFDQWFGASQLAAIEERYPIGRSCRCYYDVTNSRQVILTRDVPWKVIASIVAPLMTLAVTGGLMWLAWPLMFYRQRPREYDSPKDWKAA